MSELTNKQTDVIRDFLMQYLDCFILVSFDTDGLANNISGTGGSQLKEHALRKLIEDTVNTECIDLLLPSTSVMDELDIEWEDDDDEGEFS